jgi:alcohol dehydrogenase class IV
MPAFEFATAQKIIFGPGTLTGAGAAASQYGKKALVVTGRSGDHLARLLSGLQESQISSCIFPVAAEPDTASVMQAARLAKEEGCELVVGLGGGSVLDTAKAAAALAANDSDILDYLEVIGSGKKLQYAALPVIAIPTTAGTGSEVTRNAVITSHAHRYKASLRHPSMLPRTALVDPELTYDLPPELTASTGMDALTQCIEPFLSIRANPITDALCREGMRRAARSLRVAVSEGSDPAAREDMCLASLFGGLALANAGLGAVHGFASPIGGMFNASHGAVCARLLPFVMEANYAALQSRQPEAQGLQRFDEIAVILTGSPHATAPDGIAWLYRLAEDLPIPSLTHYGITWQDLPEIAAQAAKASSMKANPIELTQAELLSVLTGALETS